MDEPLQHRYQRERQLIVVLHDAEGYSFAEISKMPQFNGVSTGAVFKRYKKQKRAYTVGLTKGIQ